MLIAFYKPYDVLSQFTQEHPSHRTLAEFGFPSRVYSIGRLDRDSEGLLLLSDEARWTDRLLNPRRGHSRTYHAQVEGEVTDEALRRLARGGVDLKDFLTLPCRATRLETEPLHPPRDPPVRFRKTVPTSWIELTLTEGKNRQVRRMSAAVGFPTLRLIRVRIGGLALADLKIESGQWRELLAAEVKQTLHER
jgi:23S rRNA pseudouridine2457 synthase